MQKMILASNNAGKLREMRAILQPFGFEVLSQREAGFCEEVEETGTSFAENAQLKAQAVYQALHVPVLADDSGLMHWMVRRVFIPIGLPERMRPISSAVRSC